MGRQYYCEYCDRAFRDTVEDRRKHQQTAAHENAKSEYEIDLLRELSHKYASRLPTHFSPEEYTLLMEVITKPRACKFHTNFTTTSVTSPLQTHLCQQSQCKYGNRCNNSHLLSASQIKEYRHKFLSELSSSKGQSDGAQVMVHNPSALSKSKRQAKKEIYLNLWLERRFGLEDRSTEQICQLLAR